MGTIYLQAIVQTNDFAFALSVRTHYTSFVGTGGTGHRGFSLHIAYILHTYVFDHLSLRA